MIRALNSSNMKSARRVQGLAILFLTWSLAGCGLWSKATDPTQDWSAEKFYQEAKSALDSGNFERAIDYFETLEARYPFGPYAEQAEIEVVYAYYKYDEPESALVAADRFIRLHPRHPKVDYVYYLRGLINFDRGQGFVERYFGQDISERDPVPLRQSFQDFSELVTKFPTSRYTPDSRQRLVFLRNNLARYEVHVADYYRRRTAWVAAVNRAKYVVEHYPESPALRDALQLLVEGYTALGYTQLAADTERVLRLNFPAATEQAKKSRLVDFLPFKSRKEEVE